MVGINQKKTIGNWEYIKIRDDKSTPNADWVVLGIEESFKNPVLQNDIINIKPLKRLKYTHYPDYNKVYKNPQDNHPPLHNPDYKKVYKNPQYNHPPLHNPDYKTVYSNPQDNRYNNAPYHPKEMKYDNSEKSWTRVNTSHQDSSEDFKLVDNKKRKAGKK